MANPLPKTNREPQYLDYFGMPSAPFARLASTKDLYLTEQYSFLLAHLANATEQADSLILICGQNGSGKTSLLNRFITSINENICFASINEFCDNETEFFLAVLRQFGFGEIAGSVEELRYITHEFLVQQGKAGDPVLLLVDNAHLLSPNVFEQLRWMVSIKYNDLSVTNIILAGNPELARIMESPAMSQISARNHVRFNIRAYTEDETASYVWHRLDLIGCRQAVQFSPDVHSLIYRFTGGIPRLINMLCDAALQEAKAAKSKTVNGEMLRCAAERHQLVPHAVPLQNKSRRKTDPGFQHADPADVTELVESRRQPSATATPDKNQAESSAVDDANSTGTKATLPGRADPELRAQLKKLTKQLADFEKQAAQSKATIEQQSALIGELEDKLEDKSHALDLQSSEFEERSEVSRTLQTNIEKLTRKLTRQDKSSARLAADLAEKRSTISRLEAELGDANERMVSLDGLEEACRTSQQQLLDRETEATALRSELSILRRKETDLTEQLALATARLPELDVLKKAVLDLEDEAGTRSNELATARRQLSEQEKQAEKLEAKLRTTESARKSFEEEARRIPQLEVDLTDRDDRIEDIQTALIERDEELRQLRGTLEQQAATTAELEASLTAATQLAAELEERAAGIRQLEIDLTDREERLEIIQAALAERENELNMLRETLEERAASIADLEAKLHTSEDMAAGLGQKAERVPQLEGELSTSIEQVAAIQASLAERDEQLRQSNEKLEEQAATSAELEARLSDSTNLLAELEQKAAPAAELEAKLHKSEALVADLEQKAERVPQLESDLSASEEQIAAMQSSLAERDDQLHQSNEKLEEQAAASADLEARLSESAKLAVELEERIAETEKLSDIIASKDQELSALQAVLDDHSDIGQLHKAELARIGKLESQLANATGDAEKLNAELEARDSLLSQMQEDVSGAKEDNRWLKSELQRLRDVDEKLASQVNRSEALASDMLNRDSQIAELAEERGTLQKELEGAREEITALEDAMTELSAARTDVSNLQEQLADSNEVVQSLKSTLAEQSAEISELQSNTERLSDTEGSLADQEKRSDELRSRLATSEKEEMELTSRLTEQMTLLDAANQKIAQLMQSESELAKANEILAHLEQDLSEKDGAIYALETGLNEKDAAVTGLQSELEKFVGQEEELRDREQRLKELESNLQLLTERLEEQDSLRDELSRTGTRQEDLEGEITRKSEEFAALAGDHKVLVEALHEAQKNLADQAVQLSGSHSLAIHVSDLEEQLATQLQINAEVSDELDRKTRMALELEARILGLTAAGTPTTPLTALPTSGKRAGDAIRVSDGSVTIDVVFGGKITQQLVRDLAGLRCMIGRSEDNDLALDVDTVSRHHAMLSCKDDYLSIEDLNSTNGVDINYKKIATARLHFGDVVSIGDYELRIGKGDED